MEIDNKSNNKHLDIQESSNKLVITKQWNQTLGYILTGFSVLWSSVTLFIFSGFLSSFFDGDIPLFFSIIQLLFGIIPLFFILIGVGLFIGGIAHIVNKTTITVENGLVEITHGPMPIMRTQRIAQQDIMQIYSEETSTSRSNNNNVQGSKGFQLYYMNENKQARSLMGKAYFLPISLPWFDEDEARIIERRLEDFMGIEDQEVLNASNYNTIKEPKKTLYEEAKIPLEEEMSLSEENYANLYNKGERPGKEALLATPQSLVVEETMEGVFIFKKWSNPIVIFYLVFATIWNLITWTIASVVLWAIVAEGAAILVVFALFLIPFIGIGAWLLLQSLAILYNTTTIHVSNSELVITHRPISIVRSLHLALSDIKNIELQTRTGRTKNGTYTYEVTVINLNNGKDVALEPSSMMRFSDEEAQFLQQKLIRII